MNAHLSRPYRIELDVLKAVAILAVIFYHTGWLQTGYLGVDAFFVINGFLIIPSLLESIHKDTWKTKDYANYLLKRVMRLWPLALLASALCLLVGFWGMLPDDFENLAASVIANNCMSQNVLSALTTKNYWDIVNEYKPLMHFWYVGILVEFYIILPILLLSIKWLSHRIGRPFFQLAQIALWILFSLSLAAYLLPYAANYVKFYHLPFRAFELIAGGLAGIYLFQYPRGGLPRTGGLIASMVLIGIFLSSLYLPCETGELNVVNGQTSSTLLVPSSLLLLSAVILTCIVVAAKPKTNHPSLAFRSIAFLGKMSFSIFVWHQILLAFWRYFVTDAMTPCVVSILCAGTLLLSLASYYCIEKHFRPSWRSFAFLCVVALVTFLPASWVYMRDGVVRDVPELSISASSGTKQPFGKYGDRPYSYDKDFDGTPGKIKVLIAGNSFARDFANILLESPYATCIELSYFFDEQNTGNKYAARLAQCDHLFIFERKDRLTDSIWSHLNPKARVWGIGTKNFGSSNGIIYQQRHAPDYHNTSVTINSNFFLINENWKASWGEKSYIDLLSLVSLPGNKVRVFTDNKKFISQDCRHLTQEGARYYSKLINFNSIFESQPTE